MCWALCSCCFCLVTLLIKYLGDWFCDDSDPFSGVLQPVSVDSFCCLQRLRWLAVYTVIISDLNAIGMRSFTSSSVITFHSVLATCLLLVSAVLVESRHWVTSLLHRVPSLATILALLHVSFTASWSSMKMQTCHSICYNIKLFIFTCPL